MAITPNLEPEHTPLELAVQAAKAAQEQQTRVVEQVNRTNDRLDQVVRAELDQIEAILVEQKGRLLDLATRVRPVARERADFIMGTADRLNKVIEHL